MSRRMGYGARKRARRSKVVKPPRPESSLKASPYKCPDCEGVMYRHESGRFWCEECGGFKDSKA